MANLFVAGYSLGVSFQPTATGVLTQINVTGWDWAEKVAKLITTHTGAGGIEWWLPGIFSGSSRVQANFDLLNPNFAAAPFLRAGAGGLMRCAVGLTNPFILPMRLEEVHYQSAVDNLMKYDFSASIDGSQGTYSYAS